MHMALTCKIVSVKLIHVLCIILSIGRFAVHMKQKAPNTYYLALEISGVTAADQAVYKVNAQNSFGESNASIKLNFAQGN